MARFADSVRIRPSNKYYIIRETRSASEFDVRVAENVLGDIGNGVSLTKLINRALEAGASER